MKKAIAIVALSTMMMLVFAACQQAAKTEMPVDTQSESAESMETKSGYMDVTPMQAKELMETIEDLVVLDVSPKFAEGHLPNAINIYISELESRLNELDKDKPYLVYCHVDSVSKQGAQILVDNGFAEVYRLEGNYAAWVDAGYDVEK
jgi:rhodanese-related sulfurtransferase